MKDYLKMVDVFVHDSVEELEQHIYAGCMSKHCSEYAAHAINSHDELVEMNRELLDALNEVASSLSWLAHGECRGFVDGPILTSSEAINKARLAITKANGGAA